MNDPHPYWSLRFSSLQAHHEISRANFIHKKPCYSVECGKQYSVRNSAYYTLYVLRKIYEGYKIYFTAKRILYAVA